MHPHYGEVEGGMSKDQKREMLMAALLHWELADCIARHCCPLRPSTFVGLRQWCHVKAQMKQIMKALFVRSARVQGRQFGNKRLVCLGVADVQYRQPCVGRKSLCPI